MSKSDYTDQLDEQKEALFTVIDNLRDALDIDFEDMDMDNVKEWGQSLLVAGVGAFMAYKILKGIFSSKNVELEEDNAVLKGFKVKGESVVGRFVKEQAVIILLSLARKWIKNYLRTKHIIDED